MRAVRPRRLAQVVPLVAVAEPADLIDTFSRLSEWSFMVIVCAFSVTWICGAPAQFTSVMVPSIEYTLEDSAKSGGDGSGLCAGGTVVVVDGFASGSVFCSMRGPESAGGFAGAAPGRRARQAAAAWTVRATSSPGFVGRVPIFRGFLKREQSSCAARRDGPRRSRRVATCDW